MSTGTSFVFLQFGRKKIYIKELRYCIRSLLAELPEAAGHILIYTDNMTLYKNDQGVVPIDLNDQLARYTNQGTYLFRAKVCVLRDALARQKGPCVFFDSDSFVRPGFAEALRQGLAHGMMLNAELKLNPYPWIGGFSMKLPSGAVYAYDPARSRMYNSGLIGVRPGMEPMLDDALAIIDGLAAATASRTHDREQFAVAEAARLHGVPLSLNDREFVHYCSRWPKRYMRWRFSFRPELETAPLVAARPTIALNKTIARLFKFAFFTRQFVLTGSLANPQDE